MEEVRTADGLVYRVVLRDEDNPAALDTAVSEAVIEGMIVDIYTIRDGWMVVIDVSDQ